MLRPIATLALALALSFAQCVLADASISNQYTVKDINELDVRGIGQLRLTQSDTESLTVTGSDEDLKTVSVDLTKHKLTIKSEGRTSFFGLFSSGSRSDLVYDLKVKDLDTLRLSGAVNAEIGSFNLKELHVDLSGASNVQTGNVIADKLSINASGAANVKFNRVKVQEFFADLSGACNMEFRQEGESNKIMLHLSGASNVKAKKFWGKSVYAEASGASHIAVNSDDTLDLHASGASGISYGGKAVLVKQESSGVSHISKM